MAYSSKRRQAILSGSRPEPAGGTTGYSSSRRAQILNKAAPQAPVIQKTNIKPPTPTSPRWSRLMEDEYNNAKKEEVAKPPVAKTPIDQRIKLLPGLENDSRNYIGTNLIPAYKEDSALAKVGKGIVNYGAGGVLSLLKNIGGASQQAIMQADRAAVNAITGKPQQTSEMNFAKDIVGTDENNVAANIAGMALDPATYVGGGILDDLARAGRFGASAKLGTAENLAANAAAGQRSARNIPLTQQTAKSTMPTINDYVENSVAKRPQSKFLEMERVSDNEADAIKRATGIDAKGYSHALSDDDIRHIMNTHGNAEIEAKKGQLPITVDDIKKIPDIIKNHDSIEAGSVNGGRKSIKYTKRINGHVVYVEVENQSDGLLHTKTMWKKPSSATLASQAQAINVQNDGIKASNNSIIPPNPRVMQEVKAPKISTDTLTDQRERGYSVNSRTDVNNPDNLREAVTENPFTYEQIHGTDTVAKAQEIFNRGNAQSELYTSFGKNEFKPEMVPLSKMIARDMAAKGDVQGARNILADTAVKLTEAGQFSQAARLLRESDPETFFMTVDKQIKKLNEQGVKQYGKKWTNMDLTPEEINGIQNLPRGNEQAYETMMDQIGERIAKQLPSTAMEKFDAWRRIAMLLNPKTHIRNTVGNLIMSGMRKASDTIGAALEKAFVPTGERTKSFGWSLNKDLVSKVDTGWEAAKRDMLGQSRWEIDNLKSLGMEKRTFKTGWLQGLNEASLKSLNFEDNIFTKRAYKDALGQFMQANKLDTVTDAAQAYAKRRALEATFKQANMLSDFISKAKGTKGVGKLVEGAIPFSKTPANIAARAIEYSPVGLIKALYSKASGKTAATVIEDLSKGVTGSAVTALGVCLASMGWIKVERNRSDKAEGILQAEGDQPNSIITPLGSYTFDWAQPFAVPLAMGVAAYEAMSKRKDGDSLIQAVVDGVSAGGDTIVNMTMLQNIKQILGSSGSVTQKIMGIPVSYIEQAIPSLFGQIAKSVDDTKRSTYDPNPAIQEWNKIKSRIPFASKSLEYALDVWGNEQSNGGVGQQFISPGYAKEKSDDRVTNEVARLYRDSKNTDLLPKVAPTSFSADGAEYKLSPQQITEFQRTMGQANHSDILVAINTPKYAKGTDEDRISIIREIVDGNYEDMKKDMLRRLKP